MYKLIILLVTISTGLYAQNNKLSYEEIDKITYELYHKANWDSLTKYETIAEMNNIDYFYLQMRFGVAYYNQKKYRKSISNFNNAYLYNNSDTILIEYLYYANLFAGRIDNAKTFVKEMPESMQKRLNVCTSKFIESVYTEGGGSYNLDYDKITINNLPFEDDLYLTGKNKYGTYYNLLLNHRFSSSLKISHGFSYLYIQNNQMFSAKSFGKQQFYKHAEQLQYYVNMKYTIKNKGIFTLAGNLLKVNSYFNEIGSIDYLSGISDYRIYNTIYEAMEYIFYSGYEQFVGDFYFSGYCTYSNLNNNKQLIPGIDIGYYPMFNSDVYLSSRFQYPIENNKGNIVAEPAVNFRLLKSRITLLYTIGTMKNFNYNNAFIVYNGNPVTKRYGFVFSHSFKKLDIALRGYYLENKSSDVDLGTIIQKGTEYNSISFILGLKYRL